MYLKINKGAIYKYYRYSIFYYCADFIVRIRFYFRIKVLFKNEIYFLFKKNTFTFE